MDFVSKATAENTGTGDSPGADASGNSGTSGRIGPKSGTGGATAIKTIAKAVISMSTKKIITTVVIVLLSAAVITAGMIFLPPLFNSPDDTTPPDITSTGTTGNIPGGENTNTPGSVDNVSTPSGTNGPVEIDGGTYEGEWDTGGERSGYGVWIYHNFRYEGYWENDMPNGAGTLYEALKPPDGAETFYKSIQGFWVNGFANGEIKYRQHYSNSRTAMTWQFNVANGYPINDETVYMENGGTPLPISKNSLMAGVPQWANVGTDSTIDAPQGNSFTPPPNTLKYTLPPYDEEHKALIEEWMIRIGQYADIDIENVLDKTYEKYGQYLNVNISKDAVKAGIKNRDISSFIHGKEPQWNISGISPDAVAKVNEFLVNNGEDPIGITDEDLLKTHNELMWNVGMKPFPAILMPEENIMVFWLAASLFYDPDVEMANTPCYDIATAFALTITDPSTTGEKSFQDAVWSIWSDYVKLYDGGDDAIAKLNP